MTGSPLPSNPLLGIGLRLAATTSFGIMAALIKLGYEAGASVVELVFFRLAAGFIPLLAWIVWSGNYGVWRTQRPLAHVLRAILGLTAMALGFSALFFLPLAEATTIGFAAPLFAVILSALILRERVGAHRWSAVLAGLLGVLIVMRPGGSALPLTGMALALIAAFAVGCVTITIRSIARTDTTQTIVFWFTAIATLAAATAMPAFGQWHDGMTFAILIAVGLSGGLGQLLMTAALRFAPVATIVPFDYFQLLWAVWFGWWIWGAQPQASTWAGAAMIIAGGLYTLYRERRLGREKPHAATPL